MSQGPVALVATHRPHQADRPMALVATHRPMALATTDHRSATAMTMPPDLGKFVLAVQITATVGWVGAVGRVGFQSSK
jgi:hypothetical protein